MLITYLGFIFLGIILLCVINSIISLIVNRNSPVDKQNKKLIDNMNKLKNK